MNTHQIIKNIAAICAFIGMPCFCGDNTSMSEPFSWFDALSGRKQKVEKEALEKKIAARVNIPKIKVDERLKIEKLAKKKLSPEAKQQLEEEIIKNQEAAISAARKRAQTEIEQEEYKAAKQKQEEADRARALKRFELRKKSYTRTLRKAPYGDLEEYAYLEAQQERKKQKKREQEKEKAELKTWDTYRTDPKFIKQAESELSILEQITTPDEQIAEKAFDLATKAYYEDLDKRELEEQQKKALEDRKWYEDRRAELKNVKSGITTRVKSLYDVLGQSKTQLGKKITEYQTQARKRIVEKSAEPAIKEILAREKALEPLRAEYIKQTDEKDLAQIRKELSTQGKGWFGMPYTIPADEKKVQEMAAQRKAKEWEKQFYMGMPVTPIPMKQPLSAPIPQPSSWWTRLKQQFSNAQQAYQIPSG